MFGHNHKYINAKPIVGGRIALTGLAAILLAFGSLHTYLAAGMLPSDLAVATPAAGQAPRPSDRTAAIAPNTLSVDQSTVDSQQPAVESELPSEVGSTAELSQLSIPEDVSGEDDSLGVDQAIEAGAQAGTSDEVRKLSVAPSTQTLLPEDHPAWITAEPDYSSETHRFAVGSIPTSNLDDADEALDEPLLAAVYGYIDEQIIGKRNASGELRAQVDVDYIRKNLVDQPEGYVAELSTSEGPMYQKWLSVSVTPEQQSQLRTWYDEAIQRRRLGPIGLGLLSLITFVGVTHLALRRRHGLPQMQSLRNEDANPAQGHVKRKGGGRSVLAVMFLLLTLVGLLVAGRVIVSNVAVRKQAVVETVKRVEIQPTPTHVIVQQSLADAEHKLRSNSEAFSQSVIHSAELPDGRVEVKLNTGGQQIILRRNSP